MENDKKFIESYLVDDYEILTDTGFVDIKEAHVTKKFKVWEIKTTNHSLKCADKHIVFTDKMEEIFVKDLKIGFKIQTEAVIEEITDIIEYDHEENMYDLGLGDETNHRYYTDGILSHNTVAYSIFSLWFTIFNLDKKILICAQRKDNALDFLSKIQLSYELLPTWLKPGIKEWNKGKIEFANGSSIQGIATSENAARGGSFECVTGETIVYFKDYDGFIYETEIQNLSHTNLINIL